MLTEGRFEGRVAFAQRLREALTCAVQEGWPEIMVSDATFEDWPWRERDVVDLLRAWSKQGGISPCWLADTMLLSVIRRAL